MKHYKKKGVLWLGTLVLILVLGFAVMSCTVGATPLSANGKLSVKGTRIVNAKGKTFQIKGVSTHGLAWFPEYVSKAAFKDLRDKWGANTVRLAMYTAEYGGYCSGGDKAALKAKVNEGVKAATDLGMYVIIDWHILNDNNQPFSKAGQKAAISFFREMAKKYKNQKNVLYEICNEPNGGNGGSWSNVKSYAKAVIKAIRKIDKDAIIIVGTPTWCQDVDEVAKSPLSGSNLVYSLHFYAGTHKDSYRQKAETAIKAGLPLLVSEFGISDASGNGSLDTSEGNKWISFLNKNGIGYVAWNLSNKAESSALLKSSTGKKSGWSWSNLSKSGQWLVKTYGGKLAKGKAGTSAAADSDTIENDPSANQTGSQNETAQGGTSQDGTGSQSGTTQNETTQTETNQSGTNQSESNQPGTAASKAVKASSKYAKATVQAMGSWSDGQRYYTQYKLTVKNKSKKTISNWKVKVKFKYAIQKNNEWSGKFTYKNKYVVIRPTAYNKKISAKQSVTDIGFIVSSSSAKNKVTSVKIVELKVKKP